MVAGLDSFVNSLFMSIAFERSEMERGDAYEDDSRSAPRRRAVREAKTALR